MAALGNGVASHTTLCTGRPPGGLHRVRCGALILLLLFLAMDAPVSYLCARRPLRKGFSFLVSGHGAPCLHIINAQCSLGDWGAEAQALLPLKTSISPLPQMHTMDASWQLSGQPYTYGLGSGFVGSW